MPCSFCSGGRWDEFVTCYQSPGIGVPGVGGSQALGEREAGPLRNHKEARGEWARKDPGKRSSLDILGRKGGYGVKEKVAPGQWHTLRVEFAGNRFSVIFNGKKLFEVEDDTFAASGKVGVWTKADSVTLFDDFRYGRK